MTLICCVDDALGLAFASRRQSRDSAVCRDIAALAAAAPVSMLPYSAALFKGLDINIVPQETEAEFCFLELSSPASVAGKADRLVLYRWNRRYPADVYFDVPLSGWLLAESKEFQGSSHEKISREVYIREK